VGNRAKIKTIWSRDCEGPEDVGNRVKMEKIWLRDG
jgi:hypothetical protein